MPPRPQLAWKPRVVLTSVTRVEVEEAPSPLLEAIRSYLESAR